MSTPASIRTHVPARDPVPSTVDWRHQAACRTADPELFFPLAGSRADAARAWCAACPVRAACLADALEHGDRGIRGGLTEDERRSLRRQQAAR